jgi:ribosomal protein S18 acetylase RimI-like enzyme
MADILQPTVDTTTLLKAHYRFQLGCFVSEQQDANGGIFAFSDVTPAPMWNHAAWTDLADDFSTFLQKARDWQSAKNRRPVIYVADPTAAQLEQLQQQGFERFDEEAWMVAEPGDFAWQTSELASEVHDQPSLNRFIETFSASFQIKESGYRRVLVQHQPHNSIRSRHFILHDDSGAVVSVGTVIADAEIACLYNVGTPSGQRGRGYGGRIFQHIAAAVVNNGCKTLFLQVENNSNAKRLYEKNGFRTSFVRVGFRLKDWQPNRIQRTKLSNLLGHKPSENHVPRYLRETRALGSEVTTALNRFSGSNGVESAYLAAWSYLIHRYTGVDSATFTVCDHPTNSRRPLSVRVDRAATVQSWITKLPQSSAPSDSDAAESFLCFNRKGAPSHLEDHQFPLELHITGEVETIELIFRSDLFSKDAIRRMGAHFATILQFIARNPNATVGEIELLSPTEKRQLLVDWNQTAFEPTSQSLVHLFAAQVQRTPEATALVRPATRRTATWRSPRRRRSSTRCKPPAPRAWWPFRAWARWDGTSHGCSRRRGYLSWSATSIP